MSTLFRLDASIRRESSTTRALADTIEQALAAEVPGLSITRRDVGQAPVDARAWAESIAAASTPPQQRSTAQREAAATAALLADEVLAADTLLFAVPLYNWGVSQHFKAWFDLTLNDPRIGPRTTAFAGRPAFLVTARGGAYGPGTPREGWDHATGWMRRVLADSWKLDLTVIETELTLAGLDPSMAGLRDDARRQLDDAHAAATAAAEGLVNRLLQAA